MARVSFSGPPLFGVYAGIVFLSKLQLTILVSVIYGISTNSVVSRSQRLFIEKFQ